MSSVGQGIGYVAGAVLAFYTGGASYVAMGAAIGGMIGGAIDPPKGPNIIGPKLDDLGFQSSTLGAPLARGYGTFPVLGNVIWLEGDQYREVTTTEEQGGKGGGGATVETTTYYATFAVSLLRVTDPTQTVSLRRLWIGSNLVYDAGSDNLESIIASNIDEGVNFTFYNGSDDQLPNPRWQADKGVNAVSGMPGRCYIVFEDLNLEPYSRSLAMAQVKAELVIGQATNDLDYLGDLDGIWGFSNGRMIKSVVPYGIAEFQYANVLVQPWDGTPIGVEFYSNELAVSDELIGGYSLSGMGYGNGPHLLDVRASDRPVVATLQAYGIPTITETRIRLHFQNETLSTASTIPIADFEYADYFVCIEGSEAFLFLTGYRIAKFSGAEFVSRSASAYQINKGGLSENYFFGVLDTGYSQPTSTTVYKIDRDTLALVDTYTDAVPGTWAAIQVVSDNEFYTMSSGNVYHWLNGVVVDSLLGMASFGAIDQIAVTWFSVSTFAVLNIVGRDSDKTPEVYLGHGIVDSEKASLCDIVTAECGLAGIASADLDLTALTDSDVRGYRITERGSVRAALEPLQAAFPFDVAQSGYKLRFVSRGGSSVSTIPEEDLGTVATGEQAAVLLPVAREMDTQLPRKVSVRYLDVDREYDLGEQYAERPCNSVNERVVELPIVMNSQEAARTADVLLSKDWVERTEIGPFSLPPIWRALEAADVVTVDHRGKSRVVRLTRAEYLPDGRISCNAKLTASQSYTSTATGEAPAVIGQSLVPLRGTTAAYLLDIPRIVSNQDVPGMAFAMTGLASGWPGGALLRSDDSGQTYQSIVSTNTRARVFAAGAAIGSHHGYSIDHSAVLTLTPVYSAHTLSSVTEEQFYSQSNLAAYGDDGRWEIVSFKTVTDNAGSYTVNDLLRGLYGTEWATGLHVPGDYLIMLDTTTVGFFGLPTNAIGSPRLYRAITQGASLDSATDTTDTCDANSLKPLSPVDVCGARDPTTKDWGFVAQRRSRWPVEVFSGSVVPLGETSESWVLDIYDSSFATIKRTLTSTDGTFYYSSANQVSDFGTNQSTIYYKMCMLSSVVGKGFEATGSIYRFASDDPYIEQLVWGLHFDGTNGSTTLTDVRGNSFSAVGNAKITTAVSQFGGASLILDGTGDYVSFAGSLLNVSNNNFTLDGFVRLAETGATKVLFDTRGIVHDYPCAMRLGINASNKVVFDASYGAAGVNAGWNVSITSTETLTSGQQYHVQVCRSGSTWYLFVDGGTPNTATWAGTVGAPATTSYIGAGCNGAGTLGYYLNGYMDDWRYTLYPRNTTAFTPRTTAFPDP